MASRQVYVRPTPVTEQLTVSLAALQQPKPAAGAAAATAARLLYHVRLEPADRPQCAVGLESRYVWHVSAVAPGDAANKLQPVQDLGAWLGHPMHVAIARADLAFFQHMHGEAMPQPQPRPAAANASAASPGAAAAGGGSGAHGGGQHGASHGGRRLASHIFGSREDVFGPRLSMVFTAPAPGLYLLVGQIRRGNDLILAPFFLRCK